MAASKIREIVPLVEVKELPGTPAFIAGWMCYRSKSIPVIDLCLLSAGRSCPSKLSTRIIIIDYVLTDRRPAMLGLIAEDIVEILRSKLSTAPVSAINPDDLVDQAATRIMPEEKILWFDPEMMLPAQEVDSLFALHAQILDDVQRYPISE